jgi:predicted negative regulator of RcsB-dependent stress response
MVHDRFRVRPGIARIWSAVCYSNTLALKLLIGCLILLVVGYLEFQSHQRALYHEISLRFNAVAFRVLEKSPDGPSTSADEAYQALQSQLKFNDASGGEGRCFGLFYAKSLDFG